MTHVLFQDLNDVEKDLNVSLPKPFKVSSRIHDGQELDGLSGVQGLFCGLILKTLDEIVSMRDHWAKIYQNVYSSQQQMKRLPRQGLYHLHLSSFNIVIPNGFLLSLIMQVIILPLI